MTGSQVLIAAMAVMLALMSSADAQQQPLDIQEPARPGLNASNDTRLTTEPDVSVKTTAKVVLDERAPQPTENPPGALRVADAVSQPGTVEAPRLPDAVGSLGVLALVGVLALAGAIAMTTRRRIRGEQIEKN